MADTQASVIMSLSHKKSLEYIGSQARKVERATPYFRAMAEALPLSL